MQRSNQSQQWKICFQQTLFFSFINRKQISSFHFFLNGRARFGKDYGTAFDAFQQLKLQETFIRTYFNMQIFSVSFTSLKSNTNQAKMALAATHHCSCVSGTIQHSQKYHSVQFLIKGVLIRGNNPKSSSSFCIGK